MPELSLEDTWIKASVEHVVVKIKYYSGKTKHELTEREVEPDFIGISRDGRNSGYWATFCHLRNEGPRCFKPETIFDYKATERTFVPSPHGRWEEMLGEYNARDLGSKSFKN